MLRPLLWASLLSALHVFASEFDAWAAKHSRSYASAAERVYRQRIWDANDNVISEHNQKRGGAYLLGTTDSRT